MMKSVTDSLRPKTPIDTTGSKIGKGLRSKTPVRTASKKMNSDLNISVASGSSKGSNTKLKNNSPAKKKNSSPLKKINDLTISVTTEGNKKISTITAAPKMKSRNSSPIKKNTKI